MAQGVPVRAVCPAGHLVLETAPPGRTTWRGRCPTEGCPHTVTARRIPRTPAATPAQTASDDTHRRAAPWIRLESYADLPDHAPDTGPTVEPDDAAGAGAGAEGQDHPEPRPDPVSDDGTSPYEPGPGRERPRRGWRRGRRGGHPLW